MSEVTPALISLVRDLTDREDCWFDHHGGCQAHGFLDLKPDEMCPHEEAKRWLVEQERTDVAK